jgi:hypothetical protein
VSAETYWLETPVEREWIRGACASSVTVDRSGMTRRGYASVLPREDIMTSSLDLSAPQTDPDASEDPNTETPGSDGTDTPVDNPSGSNADAHPNEL